MLGRLCPESPKILNQLALSSLMKTIKNCLILDNFGGYTSTDRMGEKNVTNTFRTREENVENNVEKRTRTRNQYPPK